MNETTDSSLGFDWRDGCGPCGGGGSCFLGMMMILRLLRRRWSQLSELQEVARDEAGIMSTSIWSRGVTLSVMRILVGLQAD